jgi:Uma2 family endonuclease
MATVAQTKLLTAEEFMAAELDEGRFELVRGEIENLPELPGFRCQVSEFFA